MSEGQVIIAIDAMGGENSPYKVLKGAEIFLEKEKYHCKVTRSPIFIFDSE